MAKVGFEYIVAAKLDVTTDTDKGWGAVKYTDGREIGPGANFNSAPSASDVKDYGDDRAVETDVSVTGGTVSTELNEPTMENEAFMLGHTYDNVTGGMIRNANDIPPYLGLGVVGKSKRNGKMVYKAKLYAKVQYHEPNDDNATKQDTVTFSHTTMEGNMYTLKNGDWKEEFEYATLAEAKTKLDEVFCITAESASEDTANSESGTAES